MGRRACLAMFDFVSCNHNRPRRFFFRRKTFCHQVVEAAADIVDDVDKYVYVNISPGLSPHFGKQEGGSNDSNVVLVNEVSAKGITPDKPWAYLVHCRQLSWRMSTNVYSRHPISTAPADMNWNAGAVTCGAWFVLVVQGRRSFVPFHVYDCYALSNKWETYWAPSEFCPFRLEEEHFKVHLVSTRKWG